MSNGPLSLIPVIGKEAANSKVTVSLLLIAALCYATFRLGSQSAEDQATRAKRDAEIVTSLATISTVVERLERDAKDTQRDIRAIEDRTNKMNVEMVELSSKVGGQPIR